MVSNNRIIDMNTNTMNHHSIVSSSLQPTISNTFTESQSQTQSHLQQLNHNHNLKTKRNENENSIDMISMFLQKTRQKQSKV